MIFIILSIALFIGLLLVLLKLTRHFASPQHLPVTAAWIDELSIDRYRPMLRLLGTEDFQDFQFLRTQPGFTPKMATKLRIQRCQIFRRYLNDLDDDFKRICLALKVVMVQSKQDRADLASTLVRSQMTFACGMMIAQVRLAGYRYGVGTVDVARLVKVFDGMRIELQTLVPAELGAGA